jgi:hypothetical protein
VSSALCRFAKHRDLHSFILSSTERICNFFRYHLYIILRLLTDLCFTATFFFTIHTSLSYKGAASFIILYNFSHVPFLVLPFKYLLIMAHVACLTCYKGQSSILISLFCEYFSLNAIFLAFCKDIFKLYNLRIWFN